jgi:DNA polymerase-3 subunit beta
MEIRVTRSEFLGELSPMQGIVERKTTIPVLSHLLLTARGDRLNLAATDLDVSLTSWCDADVKREGGIAVQAKKLVEIIRSLTGEEVLLVQEEPRVLTIRAGRSRFKIHGLAPDDFPTLPTAWRWSKVAWRAPAARTPSWCRARPSRSSSASRGTASSPMAAASTTSPSAWAGAS